MGFRFYKRVNLIPGLRMNLSRWPKSTAPN